MIQPRTMLIVADNTGAKKLMCIGSVGNVSKKGATIGDTITASVKEAIPRASVKKEEKVRAIIIRVKKTHQRSDGTLIRFDDNAVVLINPDKSPRGTRIFGPVAKEIRQKGFSKIISQATEVV